MVSNGEMLAAITSASGSHIMSINTLNRPRAVLFQSVEFWLGRTEESEQDERGLLTQSLDLLSHDHPEGLLPVYTLNEALNYTIKGRGVSDTLWNLGNDNGNTKYAKN